MMLRKISPLLVMLMCALIVSACRTKNEEFDNNVLSKPYQETEYLMGTVVTLKVYNADKKDALEPAFARVRELEAKITVNQPELDSEIEKINENAGIEPVQVSEDIFDLIQMALEYSHRSNGIFNASLGPLTKLWDIGFENAHKPKDSEIKEVLPLLDFEKVILDEEKQTVYLQEVGMRLDLGAIAKGYITDEVAIVLKEQGVTSAIIDLGGNIYVMGENSRGNSWVVGIQNPFSARGTIVGKLPVSDMTVVTSGVYERYFEEDGQVYHHLLNSETGYPFNNEVASVSIVTKHSIDGDAFSTFAFGKGVDAGLEYIESCEGVEAIFITHQQEIYITSGLKEIFTVTDESFTLMN